MTIIWSPQALGDVEAIFDYLLEENPAVAWATHERLMGHIERLVSHPGLGRPGRVPGTRELIVSGTPYLVPYRVVGDEVRILRVYHGARQWPDRFDDA
jgi:toxin ParE1/3/4